MGRERGGGGQRQGRKKESVKGISGGSVAAVDTGPAAKRGWGEGEGAGTRNCEAAHVTSAQAKELFFFFLIKQSQLERFQDASRFL